MEAWGSETETVTLYIGREAFGRQPEIWVPESDDPIDPAWAAISCCSQADGRDELDHRGRTLGLFQFETLEIAMDQAHALAGIDRDAWRACALVVNADGVIDVSGFA